MGVITLKLSMYKCVKFCLFFLLSSWNVIRDFPPFLEVSWYRFCLLLRSTSWLLEVVVMVCCVGRVVASLKIWEICEVSKISWCLERRRRLFCVSLWVNSFCYWRHVGIHGGVDRQWVPFSLESHDCFSCEFLLDVETTQLLFLSRPWYGGSHILVCVCFRTARPAF